MDKENSLQEVMETLPNGFDKLQTLEEWIAAAEEDQNFDSSYDARITQNEVAVELGRLDLLMDNFSWCLDHFETHPKGRDVLVLIKQFQWFLRHLSYFPRISIEEINEYYLYYKELLVKNNYSMRSYYQLRIERAMHCGHDEERDALLEFWEEEKTDETCFQPMDEKVLKMKLSFETGQLPTGFSMAKDLLGNPSTPVRNRAMIYPYLLMPAWNTGKMEEAKKWQEQGYFLLHKKPKHLIELSHMLLYLTVADIQKAYKLFIDHITLADECQDLHTRFYFYLASWCLLEKAQLERLHLPDEDATWFAEQVPFIAKEFDERNGNHHYENTILEWRHDAGLM